METEKELSKRRRGTRSVPYAMERKTTEHVLECQTTDTVYEIRQYP